MLKPVDIIVFDSGDLYDVLLQEYNNDTKKVDAAFAYLTDESEETLISFYLPGPEEQQFYDEITGEIADIIVKNSVLNYGNTAYIML